MEVECHRQEGHRGILLLILPRVKLQEKKQYFSDPIRIYRMLYRKCISSICFFGFLYNTCAKCKFIHTSSYLDINYYPREKIGIKKSPNIQEIFITEESLYSLHVNLKRKRCYSVNIILASWNNHWSSWQQPDANFVTLKLPFEIGCDFNAIFDTTILQGFRTCSKLNAIFFAEIFKAESQGTPWKILSGSIMVQYKHPNKSIHGVTMKKWHWLNCDKIIQVCLTQLCRL